MFKDATLKLTAWYLGVATIISFLFSAVVYHFAANEIARGIEQQSSRIYSQFPVFDHFPILRPDNDIGVSDHRFLLKLLFFNVIVLFFAGIASYLLAKKTLEPIEQAHEQQKRFTADVSHELRTPLTALRMESEVALMNNNTPSKELRQTLKSNLEEVSKLEALINNLLRLTKLEADELRQNFTKVDSLEVAKVAIESVSKKAKDRKVKVVDKLKSQPISGDKESITQLLIIALDNAIKYSPKDAVIDFSISSTAHEVIFTIKDHGIGIKKAALDHIFDRFYREDSSRNKSAQEGYGLGLSIAKMIADVHSADIVVSSKVGEGTTVKIHFPKFTDNQKT